MQYKVYFDVVRIYPLLGLGIFSNITFLSVFGTCVCVHLWFTHTHTGKKF